MLNAAAPLFTDAIAALGWRQVPGPRQRLGLLVGFAGVVVICWPELRHAHATVAGAGQVLAATLLYGVAFNLAAPLEARYGALPVIWRAEAVALAVLAPFGTAAASTSSLSWRSLLAVAALGCLGTAAAFAAFATLAGRTGPTRASVTVYFVPAVAIALGAAVRGEPIIAADLFGTALVLAGAYATSGGPHSNISGSFNAKETDHDIRATLPAHDRAAAGRSPDRRAGLHRQGPAARAGRG